MASRRHTSAGLAADFGIAALHTGFTLWHRLPMLAAALALQGKAQDAAEMQRMINEKAVALANGMLDAQREMMRLSAAAMTGRLGFADLPHVSAAIAAAGLRPAFRTVKANSRRLRRRA